MNTRQLTLLLLMSCLRSAPVFSMAGEIDEIPIIDQQQFPFDVGFMRDSADGHEINLETELYLAVATGDAVEVDYLLEHGVNPNQQSPNGTFLLDLAVYKGNKRIIAALQKNHAKSTSLATPMHYAAWFDDCLFATKLLLQGFDVNASRECSITPLHEACFRGNLAIAGFLIRHGADPNATNLWGRTPLHDALNQEHWQVAALLVGHTDLNATDSTGNKPWQMIIQRYCENIPQHATSPEDKAAIAVLLNSIRDKIDPLSNISTLHYAAHFLNEEAVNALLAVKANPNIQNFLGKTPLHDVMEPNSFKKMARSPAEILRQQATIVSQLLKAGADPNKQDDRGNTPLHIACRNRIDEVIRILLNHNARIDIRNNSNETALNLDDNEKKVIRAIPKLQAFALAMANHRRLGARSPIQTASSDYQILTPEILMRIHSLLKS